MVKFSIRNDVHIEKIIIIKIRKGERNYEKLKGNMERY